MREDGPVRVVIAEDQALLRQGIVRLLEDAGFEVVAEASDAPDLLRKVSFFGPTSRRRHPGAARQHRRRAAGRSASASPTSAW